MTVENISIAVKTTGADTAARHISSLVASLEKLEKATASMTGVANLAELGKAFSTLASNRVSVSSFNSIAKGVERLGEALKSLSVEDAHILDKVTASMARLQGVDLKGFGSAVGAAQRVGEASQQAQMAVSEDVQSIIENASQVDILTHKLDGLKDALQEAFDTGNIEKAYALRGQILQVEDAIKRATEAAKKSSSAFGSFFASLKRIAMYRALRTIIKAITQAIKEGIDNLYEYSKAHDDFAGIASSFDGLASAAQTMKNQLGATFGQMLAAAAPILIQLMQLVTQLTQVFYPLTQAIAAIEPVVSAVISVVTDLINVLISLFDLLGLNVGKIVADDATKSWKDAKKAAGDYKNTILGFDEINRLNSPGGGGGGGDTGAFSRYEVSDGDKSPFKFEWVATFKEKIDDAIGKIKDLVAELALIPDWVLIDILVKDGATQPLEGLVQTVQLFPLYATVIMAVQGNPVPLIQTVRVAIVNFVRESVGSFSELQTAYAGACATVEADSYSLAGSFEEIFASITETVNAWVNNYASCVDGVMVENATLGQDVTDTYNRLKNPLNGWVSHVWQKIEEYQEALGEVYVENATLSENMATTYATIKSNVVGAFNNIKSNISIFVSETLPKWGEWANGIAETAFKAFASIASSAYDGLSNAGENLINWLSSTSSNIASWASGTLATIGEWAQGIARNVASALKSAWESFKSFKKATGEAIDAFYEEHSFAANLIFGTRNEFSVSTGIPLIPAWGASGAFVPVFADGGIHDLSMGSLFVAGEAGAEIVTNMGGGKTGVTNVEQMKEAVREGNFELLNVVQGGINIIVKAINEIDPDITLDGQSLADSMYHYNKQAAIRYGAAMVT